MANKSTSTEEAQKRLEELRAQQAEKEKQKQAQNRRRAKRLTMNMIIITIIMTFLGIWFSSMGLYYFALLVGVGLLPGVMAYITDTKKKRLASKTVFAMNLAGLLPPVASILLGGSQDQAALNAIKEPQTWLMVYGFAFIGWGLVYLIPHITALYLEIQADFRVKKLLKRQEELLEEWGDILKRGG